MENLELFVFFGGGLVVLFALWGMVETKYPRDTEDRRTSRPRGYVGQWPPNGREPEERKPSKWAK